MPSVLPQPHNCRNAGLSVSPPYKSSVTRQEVRYTTLAGRYATHGTISPASWSPPLPLPKSFTGIMDLQGPPMRFSARNAYAHREFPAETYVQVKRHVVSRSLLKSHPFTLLTQFFRMLVNRSLWRSSPTRRRSDIK